MNKIKIFAISTSIICGGFVLAKTTTNDNDQIEVTASTEKAEYDMLEPIKVHLTIKNQTKENIYFRSDIIDYCRYDFEIKTKRFDGRFNEVPKTAFNHRIIQGGGPLVRTEGLGRRGERSETLVANLIYDMTAGATYRIIVEVPYWPESVWKRPRAPGDPPAPPMIAKTEQIFVKVNGDYLKLVKPQRN